MDPHRDRARDLDGSSAVPRGWMSRSTNVRTARSISAATLGVLLLASIGSATAAPAFSAPEAAQAVPSGGVVVAAPVTSRIGDVALVAAAIGRPSRAIANRAAMLARFTKYATFTLRSAATKDMRGVERSLYRGRFYRPAVESERLCIADRESEGHYDVVSPSGLYFGAYQVSRRLARGATWMMLKEHKKLMGDKVATAVLARLRATPMNKWPRYWQDAAFSTVMNWDYTGSGASHWAGGRWRC